MMRRAVLDDAGRWSPMCAPGALPERVGKATREALDEAGTDRRGSFRVFMVVGAFVLLFVGLAVLVSNREAALAHADSLLDFAMHLGIFVGASVVIGLIGGMLVPKSARMRLAEAASAAGKRDAVCIGCGYDLAFTPPMDDGLVTCPECSARWRLPRDESAQAVSR